MTLKTVIRMCVASLLPFVFAMTAWADCGRCSKNDCGCQGSGGVYHQVFEDAAPASRSTAYRNRGVGAKDDCGHVDDWDHEFYSCCKRGPLNDDQFCDPCCRKPYISFFGGATSVEDFFRVITTSTTPFTVERQGANLVDGYGLGTALGYRVHSYVRVEAEYAYRFNKVENWFTAVETDGVLTSLTPEAATGRVYSHAGMFNVIADLSERRVRCFSLYGGGGIGVLTIDAEIATAAANYVSDDSQFAYQFIGGVTYPWSQTVELFTEYRYLGSQDLDITDAGTGLDFGDFDYESHNLFFGVRFNR